jgi:glycosyltransferase involved in cell wall biosynthesis
VSLVIAAMRETSEHVRLIVVGDGSERGTLEQQVRDSGLAARVVFVGSADADTLVRLYGNALAVAYVPYDEDYGYVTLEAFLASKPVITASDSGGTLEFVADNENGFVCPPEAGAIAHAIRRVAADPALAARLGAAGLARARAITWDGVVEQLVG